MKYYSSFLSLFLANSLFGAPCGLTGSVDERIKDCAVAKGHFSLVLRTEEGAEIYKDNKAGLLWGGRINYEFNHFGSQKACGAELVEAKLLVNLKWRLPTIKEFELAANHGIKASLAQMNYWFWTSTPEKVKRPKRGSKRGPSSVYIDHNENNFIKPEIIVGLL